MAGTLYVYIQHALFTAVTHMVKYSTSVDSFSSDLVLSDRYTIDIQPVEATSLELIWDACRENR